MRWIAATLACTALWAQEVDPGAVFRADTRLVVLHATVVDKDGRHVPNLSRTAFHAFEDGVEQQLKIFRREDVPVSMGIIVDNSGSMRNNRQRVEAAAIALVKASNPHDEVFIVNFNDEPYRDVDFTADIGLLERGLARLDARGGTAMRDALYGSLEYARRFGKRDKKVLVVVTDGNDNMSSVSLEEVVQRAQQYEVLVYAIGLLEEEDRGEARKARRALETIARATGGNAFFPREVGEVSSIALGVAHEIRNQYILAYTPSNTALDGSYRRIRVVAKGPNRPVVRTRTGYYATAAMAKAPAPSK